MQNVYKCSRWHNFYGCFFVMNINERVCKIFTHYTEYTIHLISYSTLFLSLSLVNSSSYLHLVRSVSLYRCHRSQNWKSNLHYEGTSNIIYDNFFVYIMETTMATRERKKREKEKNAHADTKCFAYSVTTACMCVCVCGRVSFRAFYIQWTKKPKENHCSQLNWIQ